MRLFSISPEDQGAFTDVLRGLFRQQHFPDGQLIEIPEGWNELRVLCFWVFWIGGNELTTEALRGVLVARRTSHRINNNIKIEEIIGTSGDLTIVIRWGARGW